jgi:hypothetical protein
MGMPIAFAPFVIFVIANRIVGTVPGLTLAAISSAIFLARDARNKGRKVRILEIGTFILFAGLALYATVAEPTWSVIDVRLRVDFGLLIVVLITMILRRPFTLQYAQEQTSRDEWTKPGFVRTNYIITGAWAVAFALMVAAEFALLYLPKTPKWLGIGVTVAAIYGAIHSRHGIPDVSESRSTPKKYRRAS